MENTPTTSIPTGREVLVVEDEARIRTMLSQALKQMGFEATLVSSAEAATRAMAQKDFDIAILDLNLPGMGGMDFLEKIRKKDNNIQVIILTGFGDLDSARKAIHCDVVEFLTKPCALGSLEVALDRARKRRRGQIMDESAGVKPSLQFEAVDAPKTISKTVDEQDNTSEQSLEEIEQRHILSVLAKHEGNRAAAAAELGISLRKLYYRINEYQRKGLAL